MEEVTVSLRLEKKLHEQMRLHDEINWSAVLRKLIAQKLEQFETIDKEKAMKAAKSMDELRASRVFDKGKSAVATIREWREKRK